MTSGFESVVFILISDKVSGNLLSCLHNGSFFSDDHNTNYIAE